MNYQTELTKVQKLLLEIIEPKRDCKNIADFIICGVNYCNKSRKVEYSSVEIIDYVVDVINHLDTDLKQNIVDFFFVKFFEDCIDFKKYKFQYDKTINNIEDMKTVKVKSFFENVQSINKYLLHRGVLLSNLNEKHYSFLTNVLSSELNNKEANNYAIESIFRAIENIVGHQQNIFTVYKKKFFENVIDNDKEFFMHLITIKSNVFDDILDEENILKKSLDFTVKKFKESSSDVPFFFIAKLIKNKSKIDKVSFINSFDIKNMLPCVSFELNGDNLTVTTNKNETFILNYWNGFFHDLISSRDKLNINLEKNFQRYPYIIKKTLDNCLDKNIIKLTEIKLIKKNIVLELNFQNNVEKKYDMLVISQFITDLVKEYVFKYNTPGFNEENLSEYFEFILMKSMKDLKSGKKQVLKKF